MPADPSDTDLSVSDLEARAPGQDDEDPYDDTDLSRLPAWWRDAITMFEQYNLRPYRPPEFDDGVTKHTVQERLEAEFGIEISFVVINPDYGGDWEVRIDDQPIGTIGRHRSPRGNTVFEMESGEFERFVKSNVHSRED